VYGIHLQNINFGDAYVETWNGAAWVNPVLIRADTDFLSIQYTLDGDVVAPDLTVVGPWGGDRYIKLDELVGSYCEFDPSGSPIVRKIVSNSEGGAYRTAAGGLPPKVAEFLVEGDLSAVPAAGVMHIRQDSATHLFPSSSTAYTKFRLRIPVQDTAEGYFKIGAMVLGPVLFFGTDYSHGRLLTLEPNQEITTGRSGDRLVEELGPARRRIEFSWTDGWDSRATSGDSPRDWTEIAYHVTAPGGGAGVREDPSVLEGMLLRSRGAAETVVYLPRVPHVDGVKQPETITGRERHLYGRIVSKVTRQVILGDEDSAAKGEVQAVNAIAIDEEL
tara:strand:+ start:213 stop:1208 length:996 start_codon:yes stop_codon:yes gene_type:complete